MLLGPRADVLGYGLAASPIMITNKSSLNPPAVAWLLYLRCAFLQQLAIAPYGRHRFFQLDTAPRFCQSNAKLAAELAAVSLAPLPMF